jgi:hypothetical protein
MAPIRRGCVANLRLSRIKDHYIEPAIEASLVLSDVRCTPVDAVYVDK